MPIWNNADLIAKIEIRAQGRPSSRRRSGLAEAHGDAARPRHGYVLPAYEDPRTGCRSEAELPVNVDPADSKLSRSRRPRADGAGVRRGAQQAAAASCCRSSAGTRRARSALAANAGKLRRSQSVPDRRATRRSGLRLPIGSLGHMCRPTDYPYVVERDPMEPRCDARRVDNDAGRSAAAQAAPRLKEQRSRQPVRTAMSVEIRDGVLCAFMPPVERLEDYLELIAAIEATAEEMQIQVHIEGYAPPYDPRIEVIKVTPDPGVIEVNVQPAKSWREAVDITLGLYEDAGKDAPRRQPLHDRRPPHRHRRRQSCRGRRLARRRTRRSCAGPTCSKSLVLYWQRHPSLSYLFSGMFIGPTSQAPRIDEARHDSLYELEIALSQVPPPGYRDAAVAGRPPVPQHLLVDITGNTHRAEICIDKLYSPDGPTGRLGLVEFRALRNAARIARMSLAQQLLIRALIAKFWREPQHGKLVRWGTALHDRFMLPHFVWEDFSGRA